MLKVGVQTKGLLPEYDVWEAFEIIHQAGFERIDFNLDTFLKNTDVYAGRINTFFDYDIEDIGRFFLPYKEAMQHYGIKASQMHAPYPVSVWGRGKQNEYMETNVIPKSIILAEFLEIPYVIIHPFKVQYRSGIEQEREENLEYFKMLIPLLKQCNVKICFENLYEATGGRIVEGVCADPQEAVAYIDTLNEYAGEELFAFCLDTGHLQLVKREPYAFITTLGKRLKCLHLHENNGLDDLHQMPFTFGAEKGEGLDWNEVMRGLRDIGFDGTLSFETFPCVNSFPKPMVKDVLETIHDIGAYFSETIGEPEKTGDSSKVRVGIIGTGRIAQRFLEDAPRAESARITCIYNPHLESAERFAEKNGRIAYTDNFDEFLTEIDMAYIASPHETHAAYIRMLLDNGKHVLCEKPMSFSQKEAESLFALAKEKGCLLWEAVKTSYCSGFLAMMEMAQSGKIGVIKDVEACFSKLTPTNIREFTNTEYGGSVTELGSYVFLPILRLLGTDYKSVTFHSIDAANGVDSYTKAVFEYENGIGTAKAGLGVKSEGQLVIAGTKGYILAESPWWLTRKFEVRYEDAQKREVYHYPYEGAGLWYELECFAKAQRKDSKEQEFAGIRPEESVAMAGIMEQFLQETHAKRHKASREKESDVKIWAHRGCSMHYPENTLLAFRAAAELPHVTGIEFDVQLTKDGEVVVIHDENVSRVTNGTKNVVEYTLNELKSLQIKAATDPEITIPTLEETLALLAPYCKKNGLKLNIELKTSVIHYAGIEEKTLALVAKYGLEDYVVYSSFWAESVKRIKELCPSAQTGMLAGTLSDCIKWGNYAHTDALHPSVAGLDCDIPEDRAENPVRAWNAEEPLCGDKRILKEKNLRKYAMFGVTDIFTNVPENYR